MDSVAVLDALTPDPGWETEVAFLSTYSTDLVAAAAVVMALAGEGDDHERIRNAGLARACEGMRDRFRIVCQAGRVVVPQTGASTLVLADRWIREVKHDGNEKSWHAKIALVRYRPTRDAIDVPIWRLWLGSRNLTRDTSWDTAILAVGQHGIPNPIDQSIARIGRVMASRAELPDWSPDRISRDLAQVHWEWPQEVEQVISLALWPDADAATGLPEPPTGLRHLVVVGPFADGTTARSLGGWGNGTRRQILTTPNTLATLMAQKGRPLGGFDSLHRLEESAAAEDGDSERDETGSDQMVEVHRGLHAKLILASGTDGDHLWLGSANLTKRAWSGLNTEVVAHLQVAPTVRDGLVNGIVDGLSTEVPRDSDVDPPLPDDPIEKHLDEHRNRIAAMWDARLIRSKEVPGYRCKLGRSPVGRRDRVALTVRLLGQAPAVPWIPDSLEVVLAPVPPHHETELLSLELRALDRPSSSVSWISRAHLEPPPEVTRDRAVLARLMGPRAFLSWLRSMLDEITGDEGGDTWPEPEPRDPDGGDWRKAYGSRLEAPTLEAVLRAWARDPEAVRRIDQALFLWAVEMRKALAEEWDASEQEALSELSRFEDAWKVVRTGLGLGEAVE